MTQNDTIQRQLANEIDATNEATLATTIKTLFDAAYALIGAIDAATDQFAPEVAALTAAAAAADTDENMSLMRAVPDMVAALEIIAAGNTDPDRMVEIAEKALGDPHP